MKRMKFIKTITMAAVISGGLILASCTALQSSLSSEQEKALTEATGVSYLTEKAWYYNGLYTTNMSQFTTKLSDSYINQSLKVCFTKQVAATQVSGSITLNFKDQDGCSATKVFTDIKGTFTDDYKAYKVDMTDVMKLFNTVSIPSGEASMNLKLTGFVCAEGNQKGRALAAVDEKGIKIQPLFKDMTVDFSTSGLTAASKIEFDVNSDVVLEGGNYTVYGTATNGKDYSFNVSSENSTIYLGLKDGFDFADVTALKNELNDYSINLKLQNICPVSGGDSYSNEIRINFTKYSIVIDGKKDTNFSSEKGAVVAVDSVKDQNAFAGLGYDVGSQTDIQEVYVHNDDYYLYVGVNGSFNLTWNNGLVILVSNGKVTGANGAAISTFSSASTETYANKSGSRTKIQPNVYIAHQPGINNTGAGKIQASAYVSASNNDISSKILCGPMGCTDETALTYLEYAIPLADSGLTSGDDVSLIVAASLLWDEGNAVVDVAPDAGVSKYDENHTSVTYDFNNGIKYQIK